MLNSGPSLPLSRLKQINDHHKKYLLEVQQETPVLVKDEISEECEKSFYAFMKHAWPWIVGGKPFMHGWHLQALCEHLEAVYRRDITNLLINIPPRHGKSLILAVGFNAWVWIHDPAHLFLYASHSLPLSLNDARRTRYLVASDWYRKRWGDKVKLLVDQQAKGRFTTTALGERVTISVNSGVAGLGGNTKILDDPNDLKEGDADTESIREWCGEIWPSRSNPGQVVAHILNQQRTGVRDVSSLYLADDDWVKFILPMEYESARKCISVPLPSTNGCKWQDPRTEEGEILWQAEWTPAKVAKKKEKIAAYVWATQYQQRPAPEEGGIIKRAHFALWKSVRPPTCKFVIQSWDTAVSTAKEASFSAMTTWGIFETDSNEDHIILLSMWRGRLEYPDLRRMAIRLALNYHDTLFMKPKDIRNIEKSIYVPNRLIIEAKSSGHPLYQDLSRVKQINESHVIITPFNPTPYGKKVQRLRYVSHLIEAGRVWLPTQPPDFTKLRQFADVFREEAAAFPSANANDLIDSMSQALCIIYEGGLVQHPDDQQQDQDAYLDQQYGGERKPIY